MSETKLTPWFDGQIIPDREGVYQRDYSGDIQYCLYTNLFWRRPADTVAEAEKETHMSGWQELPWRGLAEKLK
jgi:hypothetical protein